MEYNNIKWCAVQPLTGGMYLGTEKAIGHKAEFILSFDNLASPQKINKETGDIISVGNEYSLMKYLEKKNDSPDYRIFDRDMFSIDENINVNIKQCEWSKSDDPLDFSNIDLCVAVPVCSGLSMSSFLTDDNVKLKNCNMLWITRYVCNIIRPKCYIFENAPTMLSSKADNVRNELELIAYNSGYSVIYYKTDTKWHNNCQKRKRTFVLFFRQYDMNNIKNPTLSYEHNNILIDEYLNMIPDNASQQTVIPMHYNNQIIHEYFKYKFGDNWIDNVQSSSKYIIKHDLYEDVIDFVNKSSFKENQKKSITHVMHHIKEKTSLGLGFYDTYLVRPKDMLSNAIIFKNMVKEIHYKYNRLYTIRECLWLMGMPHDFELQGDTNIEFEKIGQNVPVMTAYWIVKEAINNINLDKEYNNKFIRVFDNNAQKELNYEFN